MSAHAYAVGHHIVFGAGRFAPATEDGQRLLAHELAHVVPEPASAASLRRQPDGGSTPSTLSAALEHIRHITIILTTEAKVQAVLDALRDIDLSDPTKESTAPFHRMPDGSKFQMTIDHIVERQSDPTRALDPSNVRIVSRRGNTVPLRQITEQDPFQR